MNDQPTPPAEADSSFEPVPVRVRRDGWTPDRQCLFIAALRSTRCVNRAAQMAGMSRESAYRLRARADAASFAAAWDAALATRACGSSAPSLLWHRAIHGTRTPIIRNGEPVGFVERADNNALLKLLRRFDRQAGGAERRRSRKGKSQ